MSVSYIMDKRSGMSKVLHTYLDNNNQNAFSKNHARNLTTQEQAVVLELNHLHKKMGVLICELIMIRSLLIEQASEDLKYISNNINRITFSLVGQRRLMNLVKECYNRFEPDEDEREAIDLFINDIHKRLDHLRKVSIPSNIELTPLKEYMDILGGEAAFNLEIRNIFNSKREEMFDEKGNIHEPLREYVDHVIKTVSDKNMLEPYKKRLKEYMDIEKERENKKKQEFLKEKNEYEHNEAVHGLIVFSRMLYACMRGGGDNKKIGVRESQLKENAGIRRRAGHIVLCCLLNKKGELEYRYVDHLGHCIKPFVQSTIFSTSEEAEKVAEELGRKYPNRAFSAFDLSDEFGNTSCVERIV